MDRRAPPTGPLPAAGCDSGPDDRELARRAAGGDAAAVDAVLERLRCIVRFVHRLNQRLGYRLSSDRLEDVVQQVYASVWSRLSDFAGASALESWAFGFCRNCLRAEARRPLGARHGWSIVGSDDDDAGFELPSPDDGPAERVERRERADVVRGELGRLEPAEREAIELRHFEGWSFEAIARRQNVPASTIKDRCYRGLTRIKNRLRANDVRT